jgi:hypothetical protein
VRVPGSSVSFSHATLAFAGAAEEISSHPSAAELVPYQTEGSAERRNGYFVAACVLLPLAEDADDGASNPSATGGAGPDQYLKSG